MSAEGTLPTGALVFLLAAFQIGLANAISRGQWDPAAFGILVVTLAMLAWHWLRRPSGPEGPVGGRTVAVGVWTLLAILPLTFAVNTRNAPLLRALDLGAFVVVASFAPFVFGRWSEPAWLRPLRFGVAAVLVAAIGVAAIRLDPRPPIDVWHIQLRGVEVLLEGKNPYVWATVPDTDPESNFVVPYVYPPPSLYAGVFGYALFHDTRYAMLLAILVAGLGLRAVTRRAARSGKALPSVLEDAPALFFWFTPILPVVVELAWIDPMQVALVVLFVAAAAAGRSAAAGALLGLAVASKQSMFWLLPLAARVLGRDRRAWASAAVVGLVVTLPFVLWDAAAMKRACFDLLSGLPPRRDALNFTNAVWQWTHRPFPSSTAFALAAVVAFGTSWRGRTRKRGRTPPPVAVFGEGALLTYFVFFFFNRWAFANYYFLLTGLAALAAATRMSVVHISRLDGSVTGAAGSVRE